MKIQQSHQSNGRNQKKSYKHVTEEGPLVDVYSNKVTEEDCRISKERNRKWREYLAEEPLLIEPPT